MHNGGREPVNLKGWYLTDDRDGPTGIVASQSTPKNFYAVRRRTPDGQFRFFPWDAEFTFEELGTDVSERRGSENPVLLHARLRSNSEYRLRFADRVHRWFFNGDPLTPVRVVAAFQSRAARVVSRSDLPVLPMVCLATSTATVC